MFVYYTKYLLFHALAHVCSQPFPASVPLCYYSSNSTIDPAPLTRFPLYALYIIRINAVVQNFLVNSKFLVPIHCSTPYPFFFVNWNQALGPLLRSIKAERFSTDSIECCINIVYSLAIRYEIKY